MFSSDACLSIGTLASLNATRTVIIASRSHVFAPSCRARRVVSEQQGGDQRPQLLRRWPVRREQSRFFEQTHAILDGSLSVLRQTGMRYLKRYGHHENNQTGLAAEFLESVNSGRKGNRLRVRRIQIEHTTAAAFTLIGARRRRVNRPRCWCVAVAAGTRRTWVDNVFNTVRCFPHDVGRPTC